MKFEGSMKPTLFKISILTLSSVMVSPLGWAAAWGSIRANNASHSESHSAPVVGGHTGPPAGTISRAPEPSRGWQRPAQPTGRTYEENRAPAHRGRGEMSHRPEVEARRNIPVISHDEDRDRRRWDIETERHNAYYWSGFHSGAFLNALPFGYVPVYVSGIPYFYYQGVYYQQEPSGYMVVTPPIGAVVPELPPGAEPIYVGTTVYYYAAGAFYVQEPQGFLVVVPPPGITVPYLPSGAVETNINGQLYYQADGAYFLPVMQDGTTAYLTVQP